MMTEAICMACLAFAIAEVETGNKPFSVGRHGELTQYQFRQSTWEQYSDLPFKDAPRNQVEVDKVFRDHVRWIRRAIISLEKEPSINYIAIMWNAGYGNFLHGTVPDSTLDYAMRVENLFEKSSRDCQYCGQ